MKRTVNEMVIEFREHWKNYVFQSFFATIAIFIISLSLNLKHAIITASLGSTAFIIFAMPNYLTAKPRNVVGGHIVGLLSGYLANLIPNTTFYADAVIYAFAVGLSIFIMVVTDTEHPPASGTALGIAMSGISLNVITTIIASVIVLSLIRTLFKAHLKDLT